MEPYDLKAAADARLKRSVIQRDFQGGVYWLEQRPDLEGRTILCHRDRSGEIRHVGNPAWSIGSHIGGYGGRAYVATPDGVYVVLAGSHELWFVDASGQQRQVFTPDPSWALGDLVMTTRGVTAIREISGDQVKRSIVSGLERGECDVLFEGPHFLMDLQANPAGDRVAFVHWEHPFMPWDAAQVVLAAVRQEGSLHVEELFGGSDCPSWAPRFSALGVFSLQQTLEEWITPVIHTKEGQRIVLGNASDNADVPWTSTSGAHLLCSSGALVRARRIHGEHQLQVVDEATVNLVSEVVTVEDLCESDGVIFVLGATHDERTTLFALDEATMVLEPLLERTTRMVTRLEPLAINGPDGRRIEGFFGAPEGVEHPPLIVFCHGGPTAAVDPSFDPTVQLFCSRGFAVAAPNYRGSTGYGRSYRQALDGNWGVADVADVVDYARGLIDLGVVDPTSMFIRGGSAGGLTALLALKSELFLGATGSYACTDLVQLAKVTHDFELHYLDRLLGPLPASEALYRDRSPIHRPQDLKASVLLLQGTDDVVVPASQTEDFVTRCQELGLDVEVHLFPGEGHGFRKASTLVAAYRAELNHYERLLALPKAAR